MSTNQPPGGQQPDGTPGYAQPQDPWAGGFEPGHAAVPTDPIPQSYPASHPYEPYGGYQQPGYGPGDVWSQQTVQHGGYPGYLPPRPRRIGTIVAVGLLVVLLAGGGGFAAWYLTTNRPTAVGPTVGPSTPTPSAPASSTATAFDPHAVAVDDCLFNNGTPTEPMMMVVECSTPSSFKVIKIGTGEGIPENSKGKFDRDTTSVAICQGTGYESWYAYQDAFDDAQDVFFCMTNNP